MSREDTSSPRSQNPPRRHSILSRRGMEILYDTISTRSRIMRSWINQRAFRRGQTWEPNGTRHRENGDLCFMSQDASGGVRSSRGTGMGRDLYILHASDDTVIRPQPTRKVDYLSHDWKDEDLWSSWKFFASQPRQHRQSRRLENALWRGWSKAKNKLNTVHPETINWSKDSDVTWLFGPLQAGGYADATIDTDEHLCVSSSTGPRPILKKYSMSERILGGLGTSAASFIQDGNGRLVGCSPTRKTGGDTSLKVRGKHYSTLKRKHVHFSDQVERLEITREGDKQE